MLRVWSDVLMAADTRQVTLLCLLDLSAAFDCVDHDLLLHRLQLTVGIRGVALEWICSFLTDRTQQIAYGGQLSTPCLLPFGVPQFGSGTTTDGLYTIYTADLTYVVERHSVYTSMQMTVRYT